MSHRYRKPRLTIAKILAWADEYHRRHGTWPYIKAGPIEGAVNETWYGVSFALYEGGRGLKGKSSLAALLRRHRGVYFRRNSLDDATIFKWARAHFLRTGEWPTKWSGAIRDAPGEKWSAVNFALFAGQRGLRGGSTLLKLLRKHGVRRKPYRPLKPAQILKWADQFFARHGDWPRLDSGPIRESPQNTWLAIEMALRRGTRGLDGSSSLFHFLNEHRGIYQGGSRRPYRIRPERRLDLDKIVAWAKAHRRRTGEWPGAYSGPIPGSGGTDWRSVDTALRTGYRGLPGGSSLANLFGDRRLGQKSRKQ